MAYRMPTCASSINNSLQKAKLKGTIMAYGLSNADMRIKHQ
jgi:hypothetical protein